MLFDTLKIVPKWIAIYLLKDYDLKITLSAMTGVLYASLVYITTYPDKMKESIAKYGWFSYVKRASLLVGFISYNLLYYYPSKFSTKFTQYVLFINVLEAGILSVQHKELSLIHI